VSASADDNVLVMAQRRVNKKSNEITTIPELFKTAGAFNLKVLSAVNEDAIARFSS